MNDFKFCQLALLSHVGIPLFEQGCSVRNTLAMQIQFNPGICQLVLLKLASHITYSYQVLKLLESQSSSPQQYFAVRVCDADI